MEYSVGWRTRRTANGRAGALLYFVYGRQLMLFGAVFDFRLVNPGWIGCAYSFFYWAGFFWQPWSGLESKKITNLKINCSIQNLVDLSCPNHGEHVERRRNGAGDRL